MTQHGRGHWFVLALGVAMLSAMASSAMVEDAATPRDDLALFQGSICRASLVRRSPTPRQSFRSGILLASTSRAAENINIMPACGPQPTGYHTIQEATARGDLTVALQIIMNQTTPMGYAGPLCYVYRGVPEAPTLRVQRGHRLTVRLTNDIDAEGSDYNCAIDTFVNGASCLPPHDDDPVGKPGRDGSFYPIESNVRHAATGITNLHVHGLNVSPKTCHDEVIHTAIFPQQFPLEPTDLPSCQPNPNEFDYSYDIPADEPPGLYWYHSHEHGEAQAQVMMGLSGAIVIEDGEDNLRRAAGVQDDVLVVRDYPLPGSIGASPRQPARQIAEQVPASAIPTAGDADHNGSFVDPRVDRLHEGACGPGASPLGGVETKLITFNGTNVSDGFPSDSQVMRMTLKPNERRLWRLLNASGNTYISPALTLVQNGVKKRLPLMVVGRDGVPVADDDGHRSIQIQPPSRPVLMGPGNRLEFLVHAPPAGAKLYLDTEAVTVGCGGDLNPARRLLLVTSAGSPMPPAPADDSDIAPHAQDLKFAHILATTPTVFRTLEFSEFPRPFGQAHTIWPNGKPQQVDQGELDFFLTETLASNDPRMPVALRPFNMNGPPQITIHLQHQTQVTEQWTLQNYTNEVHAFHMHQIHFRVISDTVNGQPLQDVINMPAAVQLPDGHPGKPGQVIIRLTFTRAYLGEFVFHCHILEHEDNGMMGKILVQD